MGSLGKSGIIVTKDKGKIKYEPITNDVHGFEDGLRKGEVSLDVEHGALYDKDGNPIVGYQGNEHSIPVDERLLQVQGGTFTHFHPDKDFGGTLSMADLRTFSKSQLNELRAVSGQGYLYSVKATENLDRDKLEKWVNKNQKLAQKNLNAAYESALKKAVTPLKSGPHKGKVKLTSPSTGKVIYRNPMTPKQAVAFARRYSVQMFDKMYKKNLSKLGLTYTATKKL